MANRRNQFVSAPVVAVCGWLAPGAGYWLLGQRGRAATIGITVLILFALGVLIGGVRVVEAPPADHLLQKPWFIGQVLAGPVSIAAVAASTHVDVEAHARLGEIGTLYTAVAGMLNLLALIDSTYRAGEKVRIMTILLAAAGYHYQPFIDPLPVWNYWYLLLLPLCAGVSIVYKSIKCASMSQVPRQALSIFFWIILGLCAAAAGLAGLVWLLEQR